MGGPPNQTLVADGAGNFTNTVTVGVTTPVAVLTLTANASDALANIASPYPFALTIGTVNDIWNGGGNNDNWSNSTNWVGGTAPGFGYSLIFAGVTRPTPLMDASNDIYAVTFDNTAASFLITAGGGGTLTLTGGVTNNSPNSQTLSVPVVLGAPVTVNAATAAVTLGQTIDNGGNLLTVADGGRTTVLAGVVSGSGGLAKYGPGTNSLYANNTFTGGITISNGTLTVGSLPIGASGLLGGGVYSGTIADNGTLTFNSGASQNLLGAISGTGALNQIGSASLTLSAANTVGGPTTVSGGTLFVSNSLALQNSTLNFAGGKVNLTGLTSVTLGGLGGTQKLDLLNNSSAGVALNVGGNNSNTLYSGILSGSGASLTKTGTGTLTLTGSNSYTGTTTVNAGTLENFSAGGLNGGALGGAGFSGGRRHPGFFRHNHLQRVEQCLSRKLRLRHFGCHHRTQRRRPAHQADWRQFLRPVPHLAAHRPVSHRAHGHRTHRGGHDLRPLRQRRGRHRQSRRAHHRHRQLFRIPSASMPANFCRDQ